MIRYALLFVFLILGGLLYGFLLGQSTRQIGGRFAGVPIDVYGDETAWTVYLSYGKPGTSGGWQEIRLYGEGPDLLRVVQVAQASETWLGFETAAPLQLDWPERFGIQGEIIRVEAVEPGAETWLQGDS